MQWPASPTRPSRQEDAQKHSHSLAPPALVAGSSPMRMTNRTGPLAAARAAAEGRHVPDEDLLLVEGTGENSPPPHSARKHLAQSVGKLLLSAKKKKKKATVVAFASSSADDAARATASAAAAAAQPPSALRSFEALLADIDRHLTLGGTSSAEKGGRKRDTKGNGEDFAAALAAATAGGGPLGTAPRAARPPRRDGASASPSANLIDLGGDEDEGEVEAAASFPAPAEAAAAKGRSIRQPNFFDCGEEADAAAVVDAPAATTTAAAAVSSSYEDAPEIEEGCGECGFDDGEEEEEAGACSTPSGGASFSRSAPATASKGLVASVLDWAGSGREGGNCSVAASSRGGVGSRRPEEGGDGEEDSEAASVAAAGNPLTDGDGGSTAEVAALESLLEASERERSRLARELDAARRDLASARSALRLQRGAAADVLRKLKGEEGGTGAGVPDVRAAATAAEAEETPPSAIAASPSPAAAAAARSTKKAPSSFSPSPRRKVLEAAAAFERGGGGGGDENEAAKKMTTKGGGRRDAWSPAAAAAAAPRANSSPAAEGSKRPAWSPVGAARLIR